MSCDKIKCGNRDVDKIKPLERMKGSDMSAGTAGTDSKSDAFAVIRRVFHATNPLVNLKPVQGAINITTKAQLAALKSRNNISCFKAVGHDVTEEVIVHYRGSSHREHCKVHCKECGCVVPCFIYTGNDDVRYRISVGLAVHGKA